MHRIAMPALLLGLTTPATAEPSALDTLADRYENLDTLQATITQTQTTLGRTNRPASTMIQSWVYTIAFDRDAGSLTITAPWGDIAHSREGLLLTCHECDTYEELPAAPLSMGSLAREAHAQSDYLLQLPILDMLIGDRAHIYSHSNGVRETGESRSDTLNGTPCTVHAAIRPYSNEPEYQLPAGPQLTCPAEYWINNDTDLLERVTFDSTDASRIFNEASDEYDGRFENISSFVVSFDIDYHAVDTPLDPDDFAVNTEGLEFADPDDQRPRQAEDDLFSSADGARFIHNPVPAFEATTLTGERVSTKDLKGSVVLIDFWATWCGPCVAAMPAIQQLSEQYADQGLVVLGINQDDADSRAAVDKFLASKNITFPQILDPDDAISPNFGVSAIPTTILIDREGIVQAYAVGAHSKADYADNIQKVLAGETLPKPTPPPSPADTVDTIENLALNFFTWPAPVAAWEGMTLPTPEGDAFVMPHDVGGLATLDHKTGAISRINMPGYDTDRTTLAFAPVDDEHGGWIFATDHSYDYTDIAFTRIDRKGTRRWSVPLGIDPAIEPMYEADIQVCDIDNDGKDEFLIVVAVTESEHWESDVFLVVLENNGRAIYTKPIPIDGYGTTHLVENEGEPPVLYIFGYSQLVRVTLDF